MTLNDTVVVVEVETIGASGRGKLGEVATSALMAGPSAPRPPSICTCLTWRTAAPFDRHETSTVTRW